MSPKKNLTFEQALSELEEILNRLETGQTSLEESVKAFEQGKKLIKFCLNKLDEAEKKITKLQDHLIEE